MSIARSEKSQIKQYKSNLQKELDSAKLYSTLSGLEKDPKLSMLYRRISETEKRHAEVWAKKLREGGVSPPKHHPSWRARMLGYLAKRLGANFVLPSIQSLEKADQSNYSKTTPFGRANSKQQPISDKEMAKMAADENSHSRLLAQITGIGGGVEGGILARIEGRHRSVGGNALRAAVLGANDGLVSNLSLVMGVAGAALSGSAILISGFAGLIAGASSMALGEWLSVRSSRELYQHEIATEKSELEAAPEEEREELSLIYQSKGLDETSSSELAGRIIKNEKEALDTLAREELGIEPQTLGGSALEAALTSFMLFTVGAIIPVIPFLFASGLLSVIASVVVSAISLFAIGAGITLFTGKSVAYSGGRQVVFGLAAAAFTFLVGHLFGALI